MTKFFIFRHYFYVKYSILFLILQNCSKGIHFLLSFPLSGLFHWYKKKSNFFFLILKYKICRIFQTICRTNTINYYYIMYKLLRFCHLKFTGVVCFSQFIHSTVYTVNRNTIVKYTYVYRFVV